MRGSDAFEHGAGHLVDHVAGVEHSLGLEEEDVRLFCGDGFVLDAAWDDDELALAEAHVAVARLSGRQKSSYVPGATARRSSPSTMTTPRESSARCVSKFSEPNFSTDR